MTGKFSPLCDQYMLLTYLVWWQCTKHCAKTAHTNISILFYAHQKLPLPANVSPIPGCEQLAPEGKIDHYTPVMDDEDQ